jgi:hypothetical protein
MSNRTTCASPSALILVFLSCLSVSGQTTPVAKVIAKFSGTNGGNPASQLIQLPSGNLLGLTLSAAYYPKVPSTIFQILHSGEIQTVYTLAADGSQGSMNGGQFYNNGLVQASDGNIYGLTYSDRQSAGEGIVFRFSFPNNLEVLHRFSFDPSNLAGAVGSLVEAQDGFLYGVASEGGASGYGGLFRVGLDGTYSKIHDFALDEVGGNPFYGLVANPNGLLYGVTAATLSQGISGNGSVFQFDPKTAIVSLLAPPLSRQGFLCGPDVGSDGRIYVVYSPPPSCGTCTGTLASYGTDGSGPETLFTFPAGVVPGQGLVEASPGVFLDVSSPALLIDVAGKSLTQIPIPPHVYSGTLGNFTETAGGEYVGAYPQTTPIPFFGAIVEITGVGPKPIPSITGVFPLSVAQGDVVTVLGSYFVGASGVTLNGKAVAFSVKASGAITFTAPASPLSGTVSVTTPGGVALSRSAVTVN